jgi:hypothetical protein
MNMRVFAISATRATKYRLQVIKSASRCCDALMLPVIAYSAKWQYIVQDYFASDADNPFEFPGKSLKF